MTTQTTAQECQAKAAELQHTLETTIINDPRMRRHLQREIKAWHKLAAQRSA
jgi:hypothetical protein